MKMKTNKACDLSSISVLPPHMRRTSYAATGTEPQVFAKGQSGQLRSQPSQQSFSQPVSSQQGIFSQFSQSSLDDVVINDQRFGSQERETPVKRICSLPPINSAREESQMQSRSSSNLMQKWNASVVPEKRCRISEELEHRIGMMETSISRFGMILDSVQSDIMQVNKGTKEVVLEVENIRQKLNVHSNLLQQLEKGQEDVKTSLDGGLKSICDQLSQNIFQDGLQEISSLLSALPERIKAFISTLQNDICKYFTKELQATAFNLKAAKKKNLTPAILTSTTSMAPSQKGISYHATLQEISAFKKVAAPNVQKATLVQKVEMGRWNSVKHEQSMSRSSGGNVGHERQQGISPTKMGREWRVIIDSDEEIDGGFSCLLEEKESDMPVECWKKGYSIEDTKEETERILRKARRRKRKYSNIILIN